MNDYKDQFTPHGASLTAHRDFQMYPDQFASWQVRTAVLAIGVVPTVYELISADEADDWIERVVSAGRN